MKVHFRMNGSPEIFLTLGLSNNDPVPKIGDTFQLQNFASTATTKLDPKSLPEMYEVVDYRHICYGVHPEPDLRIMSVLSVEVTVRKISVRRYVTGPTGPQG